MNHSLNDKYCGPTILPSDQGQTTKSSTIQVFYSLYPTIDIHEMHLLLQDCIASRGGQRVGVLTT